MLKAAIYACCVFGMFGWGMSMADGQCISFRPPVGPNAGNRKEFIHYLGQVGTGLVALPAIVQYRRYVSPENQGLPREPVEAAFEGVLELGGEESEVAGQVDLQPARTSFGGLAGTLETDGGRSLTIEDVSLGRRVHVGRSRSVRGVVVDDRGSVVGEVDGVIPRSLVNRYAVPLSPEAERSVNAELGTRFDLAAVITMIAGLLNFLAMYDAYEGPAYGYDAAPLTPETPA